MTQRTVVPPDAPHTKSSWLTPAAIIAVVVAMSGYIVHEIRATRANLSTHDDMAGHPVMVERVDRLGRTLHREQQELHDDLDIVDSKVDELLRRSAP